jgi:hypothetical protein
VDDFSLHNLADASTVANAVSKIGTDCVKTTGTDSTADYIVIDGNYQFYLLYSPYCCCWRTQVIQAECVRDQLSQIS